MKLIWNVSIRGAVGHIVAALETQPGELSYAS
jgi:hypothetical protein